MVTIKDEIADGHHWRISTPHGPVHVWVPSGGGGDGTVVVVHGYYDGVDVAWSKYRYPAQFAASGRRFTFVMPEAPVSASDSVKWTSLDELLATVASEVGLPPLAMPVTALAHSGAYRTIIPWLSSPSLKHVALLDALYAGVAQFMSWAAQLGHSLDIVVTPTGAPRSNAEAAMPSIAGMVARRTSLPLDSQALGAKVLYLLSPLSHFALVEPATSLIPVLLRDRAPSTRSGVGAVIAIALAAFALWLSRR